MPPSLKTNMLWMLVGLMFWNSVVTFLWQCRCSSTWDFCFSGVYADKVGIEAAEMLLKNIRHNGCVDEFLQDQVSVRESDTRTHSATLLWPYSDSPLQLIIFMALAKGTSRIRTGAVTLHTQTAIHIAEQLTQVRNSYSTRLTQWCLFCSRHSFSFNIASLSCPGVWRSTSGHPRVWVELISH